MMENQKNIQTMREMQRYKKKYDLLYQWMNLRLNGVDIIEFFRDRKLESVALYGMGDLGRLIYKELEQYKIIKYGIDRQHPAGITDLRIFTLEDAKEKVDAILITPVLITDEIEDDIYEVLGEQTTFVFEEVLFELSRKYGVASALWQI